MYQQLVRVRDAVIPAAVSGAVNAISAYIAFRSLPSVALSVDNISSSDVTVWSRGVSLAFSLGILTTCIAALKFRKSAEARAPAVAPLVNRPFFPFVIGLAVQNAFSLFGVLVVLAVLWQRWMGTVYVGPPSAAVMVGVVAFIVAATIETRTKRGMLTEP